MSDELLSQDEIEALLAGVNQGSESTPVPEQPAEVQPQIETQSFTEPAPIQQPNIEMVNTQPSPSTVRSVQFAPLDSTPHSGLANGVDLIMDVQLQVAVELGRAQMKVKEVLGLGPGSVVELDKHAGEPVEIVVNNKIVAKGEVVVIDENFGVRITEIVNMQSKDGQAKAA